MSKSKKINYINGVNMATLKKVVIFIFGVKNVVKAGYDEQTKNFVALIRSDVYEQKKDLVEYAADFWKIKIKAV